jgi:hypothetical protein
LTVRSQITSGLGGRKDCTPENSPLESLALDLFK